MPFMKRLPGSSNLPYAVSGCVNNDLSANMMFHSCSVDDAKVA